MKSAPTATTAPIHGAGGVLLRDDCVLVIVENETDARYGKCAEMLAVPMGRIKDGEPPAKTAEREFLEEAGECVRAVRHLGTLKIPGAIVEMYLMERVDGPKKEGTLSPRCIKVADMLVSPDEKVRPPTKAAIQLAINWVNWRGMI